jgi:hypothetical protein
MELDDTFICIHDRLQVDMNCYSLLPIISQLSAEDLPHAFHGV